MLDESKIFSASIIASFLKGVKCAHSVLSLSVDICVAEQRDLSPIQEESVEEPHPVSPFGMRGTLSVNPEDR